jgi:hypothetical protein
MLKFKGQNDDSHPFRYVLGSGFITFSCWFLKILFTLLKYFVKQMAFFLCYSCSVTHICSIAYRNHEVLPKPQMSEEFNYKCNNNPLLRRIAELCKNAGCWLIEDNTYDYFMMG